MGKYAWHGEFLPRDFPDGPVDVADSWRHSGGRAHGLDLHLERFSAAAGPLPAGFVGEMLPYLREGELFPRIAAASGLLLLDVRPAPSPRPSTKLTYVWAPDPRTRPDIKGPDFSNLAAYRRRYQHAATDDTVITDARGAMLETTTGALVMWDGETLCIPDGVWLPSITLHQVAAEASRRGTPVERRPLRPELAADHPLWFLNSLHGISPVSELRVGGEVLTPPPHPDADAWRAWWWGCFTPA